MILKLVKQCAKITNNVLKYHGANNICLADYQRMDVSFNKNQVITFITCLVIHYFKQTEKVVKEVILIFLKNYMEKPLPTVNINAD